MSKTANTRPRVTTALVLAVCCGCDGGKGQAPGGAASGPEAAEWLATANNPAALASNRFDSTEDARAFVKRLYAAGAVKVRIAGDCIRSDKQTVDEEGGPWADGIWVTLPKDHSKRAAVLRICSEEAEREGFPPSRASNADDIFLWWD